MPSPRTAGPALPDRYRVTGHVANGGMAAVWAAEDTLLGRPVAVKVMAGHVAEQPDARARFQREARAAARISDHPHVVTIYDVGEHDGVPFIVMELLRGGSVADVLRDGMKLRRAQVLQWLGEAASALDAAHAAGIVHRDVKPANMLLDDRGRLALADFGIARLAYEEAVTSTGQVLGTAAYIAPEQAAGEPVTAATDRYALAVVAFELLTGRRPFVAEHFAAQARMHLEDEPPRPSQLDPELPRGVDGVLARGLAKEPDARWNTAAAMVEGLRAALDGHDVVAAAPAPATRSTRVLPSTATNARRPAVAAAGAPAAPASRLPLLLALAGALLLIVVVALATTGGDGGGDPDRPAIATNRTAPERSESRTQDEQPARTQQPESEPAATAPSATPAPPPEEQPQAGEPDLQTAAERNDRGYALYQAERFDEAIPLLEQAVDACGAANQLDPCGYALFNLGSARRRAGRFDAAIEPLERRLAEYDDRDGIVRRELELAKAGDAGPARESSKPGNGNGKKKDKDERGGGDD